jgi:hypothetical protein
MAATTPAIAYVVAMNGVQLSAWNVICCRLQKLHTTLGSLCGPGLSQRFASTVFFSFLLFTLPTFL